MESKFHHVSVNFGTIVWYASGGTELKNVWRYVWLAPFSIVLFCLYAASKYIPNRWEIVFERPVNWDYIMTLTFPLILIVSYGLLTWRLWIRRHHVRSFRSFFHTISSFDRRPLALPTVPTSLDRATFYVESLELRNIRCFSQLTVEFTGDAAVSPAALIVGDNATGKSTLLRALALGLCPESEAIGLMKRLPGTLLRHGKKEGSVSVMLRSGDNHARITTSIENVKGQERVRQTTSPSHFSWDDLFVCAYGTQRITEATSSYEGYERQHAVETLFSDSVKLMNPEVAKNNRVKPTLLTTWQARPRSRMQDFQLSG